MGVNSHCISSTVTISEANTIPALKALKKEIKDYSFFDSLNLEICSCVTEALDKLGFVYTIQGKDLTEIKFKGGKGDDSILIWPILAKFIEDDSQVLMEHDGEREITVFRSGEFETFSADEDDYDDYDEEEELSEAGEDLFEAIDAKTITEKNIIDAVKAEGHLNFVNYEGNTPLMECINALRYSEEDELAAILKTVQMLIDKGADLNSINSSGESPISLAIASEQLELVEKLIKMDVSIESSQMCDLMEEAAVYCNKEIFECLINNGLKLRENNKCLLLACQSRENKAKRLVFVSYLVEELQVDVNSRLKDNFCTNNAEFNKGATPLMAACCEGNLDLVEFLMANNADKELLDCRENNVLHYLSGQIWPDGESYPVWSRSKNKLKIIQLLLDNESQIVAKNTSRLSPYLLAKRDFKEALSIYRDYLSLKEIKLPVSCNEELSGPVEYYRKDKLAYQLNFKNGILHGEQIFYHNNGDKFAAVEYSDGIADGSYQAWNKDGSMFFDANCEAGKWHGCVKTYGPSGFVAQELNYHQGRRHGKQMMTAEDGTMILEAFYENGKKNGRFYYCQPDGEVVLDDVFESDALVSEEVTESKEESNPLMDLFGALLGGDPKSSLTTIMLEEKMEPSSKLFFNNPKKVIALFEKTQDSLLDNI